MDIKELLIKYSLLKEKYGELANEIGILIVNGIKNERYKQIEFEAKQLEEEMNSISKKFIENFII